MRHISNTPASEDRCIQSEEQPVSHTAWLYALDGAGRTRFRFPWRPGLTKLSRESGRFWRRLDPPASSDLVLRAFPEERKFKLWMFHDATRSARSALTRRVELLYALPGSRSTGVVQHRAK